MRICREMSEANIQRRGRLRGLPQEGLPVESDDTSEATWPWAEKVALEINVALRVPMLFLKAFFGGNYGEI